MNNEAPILPEIATPLSPITEEALRTHVSTAVEQTEDGSATLFVPELDEHYHSTKGAVTESMHIFIRMGFQPLQTTHPQVLEIGFGTGLNAFLTCLEAERMQRRVVYTSIERYPLSIELATSLGYPEQVQAMEASVATATATHSEEVLRKHKELFTALHQAPWNTAVEVTPFFTLYKIEGDFTHYAFQGPYDLIYFDAFAPEKQPEMWSPSLFNQLFSVLRPGGVLTTYCSKGVVRRTLQASGFLVERLPGPPQGKREILRGTKP